MLAPYSRPAEGYATLFPVIDVGSTLQQALYLTRASDTEPQTCEAFGLIVPNGRARKGLRLSARSISAARVAAIKHCASGPVDLCVGVSMGCRGGPIFRRIERIEAMTPGEAHAYSEAVLIAPNGLVVEKAVNPRSYRDLEAITAKLARQLSAADRAWARPFLKRYLNTFDVNWSKLTAGQFNSVFRSSRKFLASLSPKGLLPVWEGRVKASVRGTATATRQVLKREFFPKIGVVFSQPNRRALDQIAAQQGWFLRDEFGRRADALTARGRTIVERGLREGVARNVIASDLRRELPGLWNTYGKNYSRAVASVAVNRARSFAELKTYVSAGVHSLEVQAVLDERTTEICRGMDGQIIDVHLANAQVDAAASVGNPQDIAKVSPFMRVSTDQKTGARSIMTTNGTKIADVLRSGVGRSDDRGQMAFRRMGNQLPAAGVGPPPYHHLCRSWTVPRVDIVQVPRALQLRAAPGRPIVPGTVGRKPKVAPPLSPRQTRTPGPTATTPPRSRDIEQYRSPTRGRPTISGDPAFLDRVLVPQAFLARDTGIRSLAGHDLAFGEWTQSAAGNMARGGWQKVSVGSTEARLQAIMNDLRFSQRKDAFAILRTPRSKFGDIGAIVANSRLAGKETVVRIARDKVSTFVRVAPAVPWRAREGIRRLLNSGLKTKMERDKLRSILDQGKKAGWLRTGQTLDSVAVAAKSPSRIKIPAE